MAGCSRRPTSSIFWVDAEGVTSTPPLSEHILASITRRLVMEEADVREQPCTMDDLRAASEAFLASTTRETQSIAAIEDFELPYGERTRAVGADAAAADRPGAGSRLIVTVIGNRPQFVKAAAVSRRLRERFDEVIVHTGQHYDDELSRIFFEELGVPAPAHELDAGGGSNTAQTARILAALEPVLSELERSWCSCTATPTRRSRARWRRAGRPAGGPRRGRHAVLRPRDARGAERVLTDHASDLLLCSTETAVGNLEREGAAGMCTSSA